MFELLNETLFEKHMAEYLAGSKMYNQRTPKDFNIQKLVDSDMLLQFLREQPIWQKLINQGFADEQDALNIVIETINTKINRGESLLSLLKRHYKIFCVNGNTGFRNESRIFYFIHLQNEEAYERKESSSA